MPTLFSGLLEQNLSHLHFILPEVAVVVTFLVALIVDLILPPERRKTTAYICIVGLLVALVLDVRQMRDFADQVLQLKTVSKQLYSGMIVYDYYGAFFKFVILLGTIVSLLVAIHARELFGKNHGEFYLLLVAVCLGGMFLSAATNLLMIYLALESLSIVSYAMAGYLRRDRKSAEAGIKYVIYGAMASGVMIFGMSYLYGLGGTLSLLDDPAQNQPGLITQVIGEEPVPVPAKAGGPISATLKPGDTYKGAGLASKVHTFEARYPKSRGAMITILVLVFAGFLYKIAAVPFHYWAPDVYEGAPTVATGFFSVVPKAAGFAVLIRVLCAFFPLGVENGHWLNYQNVEIIVGVLAVMTMIIGNLAALGQSNAKRMLAYSSIAHAGYMLAGLSVLDNNDGPAAVLFYLVVYLFMNLGAFVCLVALENISGGCDLKQLRGAVRREPVLVVTLCIFLFSLTGLPPLGGFIGKYLIMAKLAEAGKYGMIMWIGLNSVISLYYYMKIAKAVTIDQPEEALPASTESVPASYTVIALAKSAALLLLFFYFEPIHRLCLTVIEPLSKMK